VIAHSPSLVVGTQGAILNNSKVMGTSQLGGAVYGNPNLNQNADIILNEVPTPMPILTPTLNTKAFKWLRIKNRVKGFLSVCTECCFKLIKLTF
jgi:hypothetical protein